MKEGVRLHKFMAPVTDRAVKRSRILLRINTKNSAKIILIEAPAGYGKTFSAHQIAAELDIPVLWYRVDANDCDGSTITRSLIEAIRRLEGRSLLMIKEHGNRLYLTVELLVRYLDKTFPEGITIVFDDLHLVMSDDVYCLIEDLIIAAEGCNINFILTSRSKIVFKDQKIIASGRLIRFAREDLCFSKEELKSYLEKSNYYCSEEIINAFYENTGGWVAAVNLVLLSGNPFDADKLCDINLLTDYINIEVFSSLNGETKRFLLQTSIFEILDPKICNSYLGINNSRLLLERLENKHFMLFKSIEGTYKIHDIVRKVLLKKLDNQKLLYERAAQTYINNNMTVSAIDCLLAAGLFERAAGLMGKVVPLMIQRRNWPLVEKWMSCFDKKAIVSNAFLSVTAAELELHASSIYKAEQYLVKAKKIYSSVNDRTGYARCLNVEARILRSQGKYNESLKKLEDVMKIMAGERLDLSTEKALSYLFIGDFENVEETLQKAYEKALDTMDNSIIAHIAACRAHYNYIKGDYTGALTLYKKVASLSDNDPYLIHSQRNCLASIYQDWGMLDKALDFAERDVTVKERYNLLDTLPYAYYQLGHILVDLGRYDLAEKNYCKSIAMAEKVGGETFFKILSKMLLARCYIKRKNIFKARAISKEAIQEAIREGGYIEAICCMLIGISFIQMNKLDEGERYLTRGRYLIEKARPRYFLTMLYGALAYLSMLKKDKPDLEKYGTQYFNLAVENNYIQMSVALYKLFRPVISRLPESSFTFEKRSFINELDERCKKTNFFARVTTSEKSSAEKSFEKLSCMLSESKKYPFVVNMFGLFELYHHDRRLVIKGLFSKKAMELLILLIHRGHQLTKDEIIDTLWPDTVSKNIHNVFHATLYNLRSGLKKIAPNIEHIIYECGVYRLEENVFFSTHTYYCNDLINILNDKNIGDKEISVIVDILKYYNREYLYNMDREWLEISRAFYETIFEKAVIKLSEQYIALGKYDEAVKYLYRLLELNPYMDETYYLLIKAKIESKQYHVARRIYENYVAVIRNEMNSEPIDKITKLFT